MISIKSLFSYGPGPSSLSDMQPYIITRDFCDSCSSDITTVKATIYGDLMQEDQSRFTQQAIKKAISPLVSRVSLDKGVEVEHGVCGILLEAYGRNKDLKKTNVFYFNKLGNISEINDKTLEETSSQEALDWTYSNGRSLWEFALSKDIPNLDEFIKSRWQIMEKSIFNGLKVEGGERRASLFSSRALQNRDFIQKISNTLSYSLSVIEESFNGKNIVAAPTAESSGIIPGVFYTLKEVYSVSDTRIIKGLITAGFIGKLLHKELLLGDTFSDICIATAMASAGATQIMGGSPNQVIAAAAIGLKNLKIDKTKFTPRDYIQLNALSSSKAISNATWALLSDNNLNQEIDEFNLLTSKKSLPVEV